MSKEGGALHHILGGATCINHVLGGSYKSRPGGPAINHVPGEREGGGGSN